MKTLNCDQVFEVLTRGPFPTGDAIDRPVEQHLAVCHDCRSLAEALRPAVELFHESIDPEESRDLPGYHGRLAPASRGGLAQMVAEAIEHEQPPQRMAAVIEPHEAASARSWWPSYRPSQLEAFLAAVAVGALLVLSLAGFGEIDPPAAGKSMAFTPHNDGLLHLASLELRPACFQWTPETAAAGLHCCTECHSAPSQRSLAKPALAIVTASCRACHP